MPCCVFTNVIGRPTQDKVMVGSEKDSYFIGEHAVKKEAVLKLC